MSKTNPWSPFQNPKSLALGNNCMQTNIKQTSRDLVWLTMIRIFIHARGDLKTLMSTILTNQKDVFRFFRLDFVFASIKITDYFIPPFTAFASIDTHHQPHMTPSLHQNWHFFTAPDLTLFQIEPNCSDGVGYCCLQITQDCSKFRSQFITVFKSEWERFCHLATIIQ